MAVSYDEAYALKQELESPYQERHNAHKRLRDLWHGRFWQEADGNSGIASIFRDITSRKSDVGPDWRIIRNLVFEVCVKYQTYLSSLPMIRTFVDEPYTTRRRAQATLKERVLYGTWAEANMVQSLNEIAWFGPLMGDSFLGIWPDLKNNTVKSIVRSPEYAYPVSAYDGSLEAIVFCWQVPESVARRSFPNYKPVDRPKRRGNNAEATVEILEHSGKNSFARWVDGQLVNGVDHGLGFNLFQQVPFIHVPGEPWNHGAVEQSVDMVEAGSVLYSLMMQAMVENVFPKLVLEDPMKFGETLDLGSGGVLAVNPGGKAYYLTPPGSALASGAGMLQETERSVKQDTSMPDVNFGFGQGAPSIVTGKAISELQGAGTGSLVEMVQGGYIGRSLSVWNENALTIYQRMFAEDTIYLQGVRPDSIVDLNPKQFGVKFKGSQIVGSPRNDVVFSPYVGLHEKLIIALQAQGAGLTSKRHGREQIGITDSDAMSEEIFAEAIDDAVLAGIAQAMTEPTPEAAEQTQTTASSYLEGLAVPPAAAPHPLLSAGQPTPGALPGGGQVSSPALALPPGSPVPAGGVAPAPAPPSQAGGGITLNDAIAAFQQIQFAGQVFLVGEIVDRGSTTDAVEVAVTDPADRQAVTDGVPFPTIIHVVAGEPPEQHVEVTPGSTNEPRGVSPQFDQLVA